MSSQRCNFMANSRCRFGFAKFKDVHDSETCIQGFYLLGYEVGFARVSVACALKHSSLASIHLMTL